jgi:hypothetical protein
MLRTTSCLLTLAAAALLSGCAQDRPRAYAPPGAYGQGTYGYPPSDYAGGYGYAPPPPPGGWAPPPAPCASVNGAACTAAPGMPQPFVAPPGYYVAGVTWVPVPVAGQPCQPCGETTTTTTRIVEAPARRVIRRAPPRVMHDKRVREIPIKEKRVRE